MGNGVGRTRVAVYWNVESCPIPENIKPSFIRKRIEATLKRYGYCGPLTIRAYGKLEHHTEEALRIAGVDAIKFEQVKDTAEKYMLVDISYWVSGIRCPTTCMLISEDLGFSHLVHMLKQRGHNLLLTHPNPRVSKLLGAARHVWGWPELLLDGKPLLGAAFCTSLDGPSILVIWDFENCRLPKIVNRYAVSRKIREYLKDHGYVGVVMIRAYGDTDSLSRRDLKALSKEIDVIHVDPGTDAADKSIMVDVPFLARNNMSVVMFMLISGDGDFRRLVQFLVQSGLEFVHCKPKDGASTFEPLANRVCTWPDIVTQNPSQPLPMNAASTLRPRDNSISNIIPFQSSTGQQTVVLDKHSVQDIVLNILMIAFLLVAASKPLPPYLFPNYVVVGASLNLSILVLDDLGVISVFRRESRSTYKVSKNVGDPYMFLIGAMWVFHLINAFLGYPEAIKGMELWLCSRSVNLLLLYPQLAGLKKYFGSRKIFSWRV